VIGLLLGALYKLAGRSSLHSVYNLFDRSDANNYTLSVVTDPIDPVTPFARGCAKSPLIISGLNEQSDSNFRVGCNLLAAWLQ
jgi:hypothetical protein